MLYRTVTIRRLSPHPPFKCTKVVTVTQASDDWRTPGEIAVAKMPWTNPLNLDATASDWRGRE